MPLVSIKKSHVEYELQILKNRLESEGIKCFFKNEFSAQVMSQISSFEAELQVSSEDLERALEILKQTEEL